MPLRVRMAGPAACPARRVRLAFLLGSEAFPVGVLGRESVLVQGRESRGFPLGIAIGRLLKMQTRQTRSVQECLFEGLRALREGQDPLLAGLAVARRGLGARRGCWISARASSAAVAVCESGRSIRRAELPDSVPPRWLESAPEGRARLLGPNWLRRDPRAQAYGLNWALVARARRTRGRLWFDAALPLRADGNWVGDLLIALENLEELSERRDRELRAGRLLRLGDRAAGVAHDLRNQLSLVQLEYERLRESSRLDSPSFAEGLEGALELCRDFLTVDSNGLARARLLHPILIEEIRAASTLSGRCGEVRIALRCAPDLAAVFEERLLKRILRNLLLNALAATPAGSSVRLEATRSGERHVDLSVVDEGRGMGPSELDRLLRAGESLGGTGFGTSSVLACVERLAADLDVESEPAAGTRFVLRLAAQ